MRKPLFLLLSAFTGAGTFCTAQAATDEPVYITDGQFTATLDQRAHRWRLQPLRGDEVDITDRSNACGSRETNPHGLWYVSQDDRGRPQLVAPAVTPLPSGFPQHVPLRACGDAAEESSVLFVPAVALTCINDHVGSVLIDE